MKILYRRCAALDVHKKMICACVRKCRGKGEVEVQQQTFGSFSDELEQLGDWLRGHNVKRVAMESTGVYWIPVWNVLERSRYKFDLLLVNPAIVKALPGQKTDPKDATRIAELHQYGLLRGSFIPPPAMRRWRDLIRRRAHLQQDKNRIINRMAGLLERANVKLGSVASNIVGVSGRRMLYAMVEGVRDPVRLASLAVGSLQNKHAELVRALNGRFSDHFRYQLEDLLSDLHYLEGRLERLEGSIRTELAPHEEVVRRLCTIPGVDQITAWTILAEIGLDMSVFASADHLASWAGLCPGNDESAGKRRSGRVRKGNRYLRRTLVQNAWAISHSQKDCFLTSLFLRVARRRGMKRAAMAVAHRVLVIAYHIIRDGVEYRELGGNYHDRLQPLRTTNRLVARLANLGYDVELRPKIHAAAPQSLLGEPAEPVKRGPGRPPGPAKRPYPKRHKPTCPKCAERNITCIHSAGLRPKLPPPAEESGCLRCARWGIPCIHLRTKVSRGQKSPPPT